MRWLLLHLAACVVDARLGARAKPDDLYRGPGVQILNRAAVAAITKNKTDARGWIIAFYAPWCGHCRHYAPEFKQFGKSLATYPDFRAGAVSCTAEKKACDENGVQGFPTVKAFGALGHDVILKKRSAGEMLDLVRAAAPAAVDAPRAVRPPKAAAPTIPQPTEQSLKPLRAAPALVDAAASLRFMLENVFAGGDETLSAERSVALRGLLAAAAAADVTGASAVARCLAAQPRPTKGDWAAWLAVDGVVTCHGTTERTARKRWTPRCDPDGRGVDGTAYTCGLWGLFHGLAQALDARDGLAAVRASMQFFGCETCRTHFLALYDSCSYGRCEKNADGPLWLWRAHNVVNARTHGGVADGAVAPTTPDEASAAWAWPSPAQCPNCRRHGAWQLDHVRAFLAREYGRDGDPRRPASLVAAARLILPRRPAPLAASSAPSDPPAAPASGHALLIAGLAVGCALCLCVVRLPKRRRRAYLSH